MSEEEKEELAEAAVVGRGLGRGPRRARPIGPSGRAGRFRGELFKSEQAICKGSGFLSCPDVSRG